MTRKHWGGAIFAVVVLLGVCVLVACTALPGPRRPTACATWQAPDGTWMEEDNEPVDSDPCDRGGYFGPAKPTPKPSTKKPTPVRR